MPNWNGLLLTKKGRNLQAKVETGILLNLTKMKTGSGTLGDGKQLEELTDLVEPQQNIGIATKEVLGNGLCKISAMITNNGLSKGYYVKELGIFAQDPDEGEILYAVTTDTAPDYLPAEGSATVVSQEFAVHIAIGNVTNVSAVIDPTALATMGYVELSINTHNASNTAHQAAFDKHNKDLNAHYEKIASQAEAEAQSNQNNTKFMTPLRVYQAIVAYFTKFLAAAVFTGIVKAVAPAANSNDNSVPTTSWVRTCFTTLAKQVADILEIQWKTESTGYLLLGPYLGNIKILWGRTTIDNNSVIKPVAKQISGITLFAFAFDAIASDDAATDARALAWLYKRTTNSTEYFSCYTEEVGAFVYVIVAK